jgi:hypothetical protein
MSSNILNNVPFLRTSREFPDEVKELSLQVNKSYVDTANAVNTRIIGLYAVNKAVITGSSWFVSNNQRQQTLRQVYNITGAGNIAHGIDTTKISGFTSISGVFSDGTVWYPLPYVASSGAGNQVSVRVTSTNIVITGGGGAPTVSSGWVVLEWMAQS